MGTKLRKILLEMSENRQKINELLGAGELSDDQRNDLEKRTCRMQELEVEHRASIVGDTETTVTETSVEDRRLSNLIGSASIGEIVSAVVEHRMTVGAEAELQQHFKMNGNQIPLELIEDRATTPAPADVGQNMDPIIGYVFPQSAAAFLNVSMPTVGVGEKVYPVLTTPATANTPAEGATSAETTGAFSSDVLVPGRLQASFEFSREDRARFAGMSEALRQNLSESLSNGLDKQIISGTNGFLGASGLTAPSNPPEIWLPSHSIKI